ncbi:BMC domain-containing protein [Clostridium sp. OS1-26]|uniref:BMC domain-containing protein n=1 Tax=Clostridium sp. OS1-26 TaxID=3070681 RepID=UPI0027E1B225|nr:BMC domain-containing protein [Clostridium sp. OS1-26]WML37586.1 BMC domain-containing protein [Clostridium sp. OS1-26]
MKQSTLGLIETYGFIGAVEALDVAAKAANVELVSCEFVKGGIVTIIITGEVASVKASVEAAAIAVEKLGVLRSTHVIARAYDEVRDILQDVKSSDLVKEDEVNETEVGLTEIEDSVNETEVNLTEIDLSEEFKDKTELLNSNDEVIKEEFEEEKNSEEVTDEKIKENAKIYTTREELEGMKVTELRTIARGLQNIPLTKKQIKFSKKEQLIEEILKNNRRQDK